VTLNDDERKERRLRRLTAALLFFGLFLVYHANTSVLDEGDAVPTANVPVALLTTGRLSFDPVHFPELFKWKSHPPLWERDDYFFMSWKERLFDKTAGDFFSDGVLEYVGPRYYIVESRIKGVFVSTFGPMPALFALPVTALFLALDANFWAKMSLRASVAKVTAAAMVAGSAVFVFFIALRFMSRRRALLLAVIYGLGTCAWAISSQNLWQQTVTQFLLLTGAFFLCGTKERLSWAMWSGVAFGAAAANRATGVLPIAAVCVYLARYERRALVPFLLGTLPFPALVGVYNHHYFGSPFTFAQELVGHEIAIQKTGSPVLFQTPIWRGLAGLLASPSRGLFVFSPVLALSFWGAVRAWKDPRFVILRPLTVATAITMLLQCAWFDWWGGHAYGYRPWVDAVPFLVLFIMPVLSDMLETRDRRVSLAVALSWSIFVQGLGALSYDREWNMRLLYVTRVPGVAKPRSFVDERKARAFADQHGGQFLGATYCDIDQPYCRYRLWSLEDNLIRFQLTHFKEARARRLPMGWEKLGKPL
jgi:hypothetical protein